MISLNKKSCIFIEGNAFENVVWIMAAFCLGRNALNHVVATMFIQGNEFENSFCKIAPILSRTKFVYIINFRFTSLVARQSINGMVYLVVVWYPSNNVKNCTIIKLQLNETMRENCPWYEHYSNCRPYSLHIRTVRNNDKFLNVSNLLGTLVVRTHPFRFMKTAISRFRD